MTAVTKQLYMGRREERVWKRRRLNEPSKELDMSTTGIVTRTASSTELSAVTNLCLAAFADEAVTAWVIPDPEERQCYMHEMFSASLETVIESGEVTLATDREGHAVAVSIWLTRTAIPDDPSPSPSAAEDDPRAQRMATVETATQAHRPRGPHLYLSSMATLPGYRGRGAGSAMLKAGLEQARELDLPIYLEASTPGNRRLYERFGFRNLGAPIHLPDGGPSLQPMRLDF